MIQIAFITGTRKVVTFSVSGRTVKYFDSLWKKGIQIMPKDEKLVTKLIRSGKSNLQTMALLIADSNMGENLKEYEQCRTEEQLAEMIRKDCISKGLMEVK